ncbi:MAG: nucleotidyltransferase substrate binding protein [Deltaproteobacteria bacterium]|nr:nucleotidyltransferase substrate binding protein [Deltaproteobacteria bacterium]
MESKNEKLLKAIQHLEEALLQYRNKKTELNFLTVSKAFETLVEYVWRLLKRIVEDEGLEAPSPKMAIKQAAKLHLISDPEKWLEAIEARNNSVHDYFGISEQEYSELAKEFLNLVRGSKIFHSVD